LKQRRGNPRPGAGVRRLPASLEPTPWARRLEELRGRGAALLDLAESDPTRTGLSALGESERAALADPRAARYQPDPRGLLPAREAVAAYYAERGARVSAEDILLTSGTSESYAHLFRLLADPGDAVLVPAPSYPLFEPIAALEGVRARPYRLAWEGRWSLDLDSLRAAAAAAGERARALITVEPNHPTGSCLSGEERAAVERLCADRGLALISDEVFADFPRPPRERPLPGLSGERAVPTFALGGLSKSRGLPQLKLGWIAATGPEPARRDLLERLEWIADLFLSVATPVQLALARLLEGAPAYRAGVRTRLASNLDALGRLVARAPEAEALDAEGGWSAILRLPATRSGEEWALTLLAEGVVVHPGHFYDIEGEAYLVVSLIPEPHVFRAGLERLEGRLAES
jgi:hypothetical protein